MRKYFFSGSLSHTHAHTLTRRDRVRRPSTSTVSREGVLQI